MFEKALIRRLQANKEVDIGLLAETLLFYGKTHLIVDRGSMINLIKGVGPDALLRLIKDEYLTASFFRDDFGAQSAASGGNISHLLQFHVSGHVTEPGKRWDKEDHFRNAFEQAGYDKDAAKQWAKKFAHFIPGEKLVLSGIALNVIDMATEDLRNGNYTNRVATLVMKDWFPDFNIPDDWEFLVSPGPNGLEIDTNFDFTKVTQNHPRGQFGRNNILVEMVEARADMVFSAKYSSEFITGPLRSNILKTKFDLLTIKRDHSEADLKLFQELELEGGQLRKAMNAGHQSFSSFIDLLDQSRKFKTWLAGVDPEAGLVKEYYRAVTADSWLDKLAPKSMRFAFMTGTGLLSDLLITGGIGTAAGIALGAADTFLLDRVVKGWRPNQFIENDLKPFTRQGDS